MEAGADFVVRNWPDWSGKVWITRGRCRASSVERRDAKIRVHLGFGKVRIGSEYFGLVRKTDVRPGFNAEGADACGSGKEVFSVQYSVEVFLPSPGGIQSATSATNS